MCIRRSTTVKIKRKIAFIIAGPVNDPNDGCAHMWYRNLPAPAFGGAKIAYKHR
ncbi:hypothetical protein H4S08_004778 [Coemansia sp. RSA 1365]|nr:hypothetical protein H4S08_004778 [Coemansia sp. RSA 1365]